MAKAPAAPSRSQAAYDALRRDLIDGVLEPGTRLMIGELQTAYDLGAIPLREALNRLSAEHMVLKSEQRGFSVPPLDLDDYLEIQNARLVIESAALRETLAARSGDWEDRMVVAMHHLVRAGQGEDFLLGDGWADSHRDFHATLISGCRNRRLLAYAANLYEQSARYRMRRRRLSSMRPPARASLVDEHRAIVDAALAGETERAVALLVEHYRRSVEIVYGTPIVLASGDGPRFEIGTAPESGTATA